MQRSEQLTPAVRSAALMRARTPREMPRAACLALSLALSLVALPASAQSNPRQLADANKSAMEQYNNLEIDQSKASLEKAAKNAEKNGIRGPALARTYSNLAVVLIGGFSDMKGATSAFVRALQEDPKVEPDPIVATPEVMQAFNAAKKDVKNAPPPSDEPDEVAPPMKKRASSGPPEGNLDHSPAAEQLSQTAVPIFVKKSDELEIAGVKVFYRSTGMAKPRSAELNETDDGFTYLIPCTDVFEPAVEYFLVATNEDGQTIGTLGSSENPVQVPIVSVRSEPAPSLPGEVPPSQCSADEECPPGMPGCVSHGAGGLGDTCSSDSDCGSGMICDDDFCSMGERERDEDEEEESSGGSRKKLGKRFYVDVGIGVALTAVGKGRAADRAPNLALRNEIREQATENGVINTANAEQLLAARGWDCGASVLETEEGQALRLDKCAVAVNPGGIVPVPVINLAIGYFATPKLALALTGRFQIGSGEGPLAGMLIGGRGEYYLTKPSDKGLKFGLLAGLSIGQMQARPPAKGARQGPFATNANVDGVGLVLNLGSRVAYMFTPSIGLNFTPTLNFGMPNFLFALDLNAGVSLAF
jgi:hypothetical protein